MPNIETNFGDYSKKKDDLPNAYSQWKANPDDNTYKDLMSYLEPTIQGGIRSYAQGDQSLRVRANIMAMNAVNSWDPAKGAGIKTHVHNQLKGLQRFRNKRSSVVHIPENVRSDAVKIKRYIRDYNSEHGYDPSDIQVADAMQMSMKRIQKAKRGELPASTMQSDMGDSMVTKARDPFEIWKDYVYHDLSPTNQKVFEWTMGYGGNPVLPKNEIARRLKISPAAVSMRVSTIQKRLSKVLEQ